MNEAEINVIGMKETEMDDAEIEKMTEKKTEMKYQVDKILRKICRTFQLAAEDYDSRGPHTENSIVDQEMAEAVGLIQTLRDTMKYIEIVDAESWQCFGSIDYQHPECKQCTAKLKCAMKSV